MAKGSVSSRYVPAEPRVRRGYFESRYGQLHVHNAIPPGGGFEEGTPLLCLHPIPGSGRVFERLLALAGRDRSVYAPDTPGFGDSDAPQARAAISDYAAALVDFLDTMRFRQIDVLGHQAGALLATELAITRPNQVRRVVLASVPILNDSEREVFRRAADRPASVADGTHLLAEWRRAVEAYGTQASLDTLNAALADSLRARAQTAGMAAAIAQYPVRERLPLVTHPVLVLRPKDSLWEATGRVRELLPKARIQELPEAGQDLLGAQAVAVAEAVKDFIRG
ncbi:MAG TPA: alpha/beta fold hydrolase [Steroidobacteraceae bacterium]|nr:alpha/beta fold hydrolase [Steroidobacteraceae bacterium]